jgi:hypothetical protein
LAVIVKGPPRASKVQLAEALDELEAVGPFLRHKPRRDPFEARPPEGPGAGARQKRAELLAADPQQLRFGIVGQAPGERADEFVERVVDRRAELCPAGIGVQLFKRPEPENMAGVDRVGITQPGLDVSDRELSWPRRERGTRFGRREWPVFRLVNQLDGPGHGTVGSKRRIKAGGAQHGVEAQEPA